MPTFGFVDREGEFVGDLSDAEATRGFGDFVNANGREWKVVSFRLLPADDGVPVLVVEPVATPR